MTRKTQTLISKLSDMNLTAVLNLTSACPTLSEASSHIPTFVSRAHRCYDVFAQLQQTADYPDSGLKISSSSFSELSSPGDSYGHTSTDDFNCSRLAEAFEHVGSSGADCVRLADWR